MNETLILSLCSIGATFVGSAVTSLCHSRAEAKKSAAHASSETHKADVQYDEVFLKQICDRVQVLEAGHERHEQKARRQDAHISRLLLMMERVGNEYEAMRKLLIRVAARLRAEKPIDEETLSEMEKAPAFQEVLKGTNAPPSLDIDAAPPGGNAP